MLRKACISYGTRRVSTFDYQDSPYPVREDIPEAYRAYWQRLAEPGSWWTGAERVAIAGEVRRALNCEHCARRRQALSPYSFPGEHDHGGVLDSRAVDAVHRVITDQGRITRGWVEDNTAAGLSEGHYVELVGIAVTVFSIDEFNRALGLPPEALPEPAAGEPDGYRPAVTEHETGYVAMIPPDGNRDPDSDLWPPDRTANVLRALSQVPDAVRGWRVVADAQYLSHRRMMNFGTVEGRVLDRLQIELVAGRVSSHNECFY
jgi:hypothetical protein